MWGAHISIQKKCRQFNFFQKSFLSIWVMFAKRWQSWKGKKIISSIFSCFQVFGPGVFLFVIFIIYMQRACYDFKYWLEEAKMLNYLMSTVLKKIVQAYILTIVITDFRFLFFFFFFFFYVLCFWPTLRILPKLNFCFPPIFGHSYFDPTRRNNFKKFTRIFCLQLHDPTLVPGVFFLHLSKLQISSKFVHFYLEFHNSYANLLLHTLAAGKANLEKAIVGST